MIDDVEYVLADVRLNARDLPTPANGEPLAEYALRCVSYGALLAIKPVATLTYASLARLTNDAEDRLHPAAVAPERETDANEGTPTDDDD